MSEPVRYITDDTGKQIGVLLDLEAYRQLANPLLTNPLLTDRKCLIGLSRDELVVLANCKLSPAEQSRLDDLLAQQAESALSETESIEVDRILAEADQLMVLKARALYTLKRLSNGIMSVYVPVKHGVSLTNWENHDRLARNESPSTCICPRDVGRRRQTSTKVAKRSLTAPPTSTQSLGVPTGSSSALIQKTRYLRPPYFFFNPANSRIATLLSPGFPALCPLSQQMIT